MTIYKKSLYLGVILSLLLSSAAQAVIIKELLGLDIGGTKYNVTFYDYRVSFQQIWDTDGDFRFGESDASLLGQAPTFWYDDVGALTATRAIIAALGRSNTVYDDIGDGVMVPFKRVSGFALVLRDENTTAARDSLDRQNIQPQRSYGVGTHLASFEISATIPEPTTLALTGIALAGFGYKRRKAT